MAGTLQLVTGETFEILLARIPQLLYAEYAGGVLAGLAAVLVAGVCETTLDAGIADEKSEVCPFQVERDRCVLEGAAVYEERGAGDGEQGGVLVHDAARYSDEIVLGLLAQEGEILLRVSEPEKRVERERRRGFDGRAGREPGAERHVPREGRSERRHLHPSSAQR